MDKIADSHIDRAELRIATALVNRALVKGWSISVWDSEEWAIKRSTNREAIIGALRSTDSDTLSFRDAANVRQGSVWLIWGNGEDLISDLSDNAAMTELVAGL